METKAKNQINVLLTAANVAYPDRMVENYFDLETGDEKDYEGDTLAQFIGREILGVFDDTKDLNKNALLVYDALGRAISELKAVREKMLNIA